MSASTTTKHGVFLSIFDTGVLITGAASSGKSELALALIDRGHQLIADDLVEFKLEDSACTIVGLPQKGFGEFLHLRSMGIINVNKLFGATASKAQESLQLVINLEEEESPVKSTSILGTIFAIHTLLPCTVRKEIIVEAIVRNYVLQNKGYNSEHDFFVKQKELIRGAK